MHIAWVDPEMQYKRNSVGCQRLLLDPTGLLLDLDQQFHPSYPKKDSINQPIRMHTPQSQG